MKRDPFKALVEELRENPPREEDKPNLDRLFESMRRDEERARVEFSRWLEDRKR